MIKEITVKTALCYHDRAFAANYDLNIYRGCEHRCEYCFAQYSQDYLESDFFNDIFVKVNIAEALDRELGKRSWGGHPINISGVCDCYQPLEEKYKLMEGVLKILIKYKNPAFILTKSPLIGRDFGLIKKLSETAPVCIATSITTLNEEISRKLEPNVAPALERLKIMEQFAPLGKCQRGIMLMPIIPYLTDDAENLGNIFRIGKNLRVDGIVCGSLHLRGQLKKNFFSFLEKNFPQTLPHMQRIYKTAYASRDYEAKLGAYLRGLRKKYWLFGLNADSLRKNLPAELDLFGDN
jgi:DNA repair photolyase